MTAPSSAPIHRQRRTRRAVLIADRAADLVIRTGGVGVIVAVFAIMAFLIETVWPLFLAGSGGQRIESEVAESDLRPLSTLVDEHRRLAAAVDRHGRVRLFHVETGAGMAAADFDFGGARAAAFARALEGRDLAFGFNDGSVRLARIEFRSEVVAEIPTGLRALGRDRGDGRALYSPLPDGQWRRLWLESALEAPLKLSDGPILALDYRRGGTAERPSRTLLAVDAAGLPRLLRAETRLHLLTRRATTRTVAFDLPALPDGAQATRALLTSAADQAYVAAADGRLFRYDLRDPARPALVETLRPLPAGATISAMTFLIGEQSLVLAGSDGAVDVWFRLPSETGGDGFALVKAHALEPHAGAVSGLAASERGKLLLSADVAGRVWLRHATSERTLAKLAAPQGAVEALALAPRDDGVLAFSRRQESLRILSWTVDQPHAETTLRTVFGPVWYEGYAAPGFTWQSSSGGDGFEPKLSLVPLIFGTLKATLYAMAFALPIALGAAIYTAEFLHRRIRAAVKPAIEMMASLPSVVLGFIAALVLAPLVESWVAAVILAFVALPLSLAAAAFLWQLLPAARARRLGGVPKFVLIGGVVGLGLWLAAALGPWFERLVFAGDVKAWLEGDIGSAVPFLVLLLFVPSYLAIALGTRRAAGDALAAMTRPLGRAGLAAIDLARWLAELAAALLLAWLMAAALAALGFDARGSLVEGYAQRNALVVGFAMGFAVIPIVYTIAEDALAAVPEHLRAASLGCGATPWQTAIRIVLPTALSGVFAAVMIGLGRAVGETMIVVMAAGNTPVMEWNPFGGLRTLSANIAVELPEAVRDSTLYRLLFLSALVLFAITFAVNTLAEIVRLRFRKRAASL